MVISFLRSPHSAFLSLSLLSLSLSKATPGPRTAQNLGDMAVTGSAGRPGPTLPPTRPKSPRTRPRGPRGAERVLTRLSQHQGLAQGLAESGLSAALPPSLSPACGPRSSASLPLGMTPLRPSIEGFRRMQICLPAQLKTAQNKSHSIKSELVQFCPCLGLAVAVWSWSGPGLVLVDRKSTRLNSSH